jgi:hypothetical protein
VTIHDEINQALDQLDQARQNFDYATPDFIDVAVAELAAAEVRVDLLYRLAKGCGAVCYLSAIRRGVNGTNLPV